METAPRLRKPDEALHAPRAIVQAVRLAIALGHDSPAALVCKVNLLPGHSCGIVPEVQPEADGCTVRILSGVLHRLVLMIRDGSTTSPALNIMRM